MLQLPRRNNALHYGRQGMKTIIGMMALAAALTAGTSFAADNKQQTKMSECNAQATDKKGDERKAFMKQCLSAKKETPQQAKMTTCNTEAKGMKGDERKKFMSACLKK
jgi:uncharacterized protein HemX